MKTKNVYKTSENNRARFILGDNGNNPLICIGINPSTATSDEYDQTMATLMFVSMINNFDGYVMLNLYPQRSTDPRLLHKHAKKDLIETNIKTISEFINFKHLTIWCAWGTLIEKRRYLKELLIQIVNLPELKNCTWVKRGMLTKYGHPHHPLYVKSNAEFEEFEIQEYIRHLK